MQNQVDKAESELETYKLRLHDTEAQLNAAQEATSKCEALEREVKEKNLFIGKLRHEAVILNEHLTESLRQIRRESSEALVDRRLVTNLVLQFLSFPRADTKRFEVLKLMASVLQWDDEQREKAGLQRNQDRGGGYRLFGFGSSQKAPQSPAPSGGAGDEVCTATDAVRLEPIFGIPPLGSRTWRTWRGRRQRASSTRRRCISAGL